MKQKLESVINKGKTLALASLAFLAVNCQPLHQVEPEVLHQVESEVKEDVSGLNSDCYLQQDTYRIFDQDVLFFKKYRTFPLRALYACDNEICYENKTLSLQILMHKILN